MILVPKYLLDNLCGIRITQSRARGYLWFLLCTHEAYRLVHLRTFANKVRPAFIIIQKFCCANFKSHNTSDHGY
jgi:hypothetical protein